MISLGGGNPNPGTFPYRSMTFTLQTGEVIEVSEADMQKALQYSPTNGLPDFVAWLKSLQITEHKPPYENFELCVGNGSQDVLTKACETAFEMLIAEGDYLLIESPAYVGSLAFLKPLSCQFVEVATDAEGLNPDVLENVLATWPDASTRPKVLYTVPIGGNPTGTSTTLERKKRIYEIAKRYDIIILEDDPYYYLQFGATRTASYFSMDVDRRVLRFDSLSKILSAGVRIGWVTGPAPLIERIVLHGQTTNLHPSGVSQILVYSLLKRWDIGGFISHADSVARFYATKRDVFLESANRHLTGLAKWTPPDAGMFFWIELLRIADSSDLIKTKAMEKKVLLVPGFEFFPNPRKTPYVRASFSTATPQEIDEAVSRLAELVKEARAVAGEEVPKAPFPIRLNGVVSKGFGRGSRELGIPTANLPEDVAQSMGNVLETGIYYGWASVGANQDGVNPMVMSYGWNPYYKNEKRSAEVHIMHDFGRDFYGEELRVIVAGYIRPEQNYSCLDDLITDINLDIQVAHKSLSRPAYQELKSSAFILGTEKP
ncbi:hypothetical protein HK097_009467 [Rhizophlyctis rosea]|uniref:riboflavin kinase n=1 Tax=Rhizophlyctis rosea TaxID=64517 RepID=A0AAD5SB44_9FUNG|nr:hypothetical protein HK097_009467 [Rhizophlyctis rosea]